MNDQSCSTSMCQTSEANVGQGERVMSLFVGSLLSSYGLLRGHFGGLLIAAAGAGMIYRGLSGNCQLYKALGVSTNDKAENQPLFAQGNSRAASYSN